MLEGNVLIYRDGKEGPVPLVTMANNLCGTTLTDPRPDMIGSFTVVDIVNAQIVTAPGGWSLVALVRVKSASTFMDAALSERGYVFGTIDSSNGEDITPIDSNFIVRTPQFSEN